MHVREIICFAIPAVVSKSVSLQTQRPAKSQSKSFELWWNYLLIDVAQIYGLAMIWELALNAAVGMKRIF